MFATMKRTAALRNQERLTERRLQAQYRLEGLWEHDKAEYDRLVEQEETLPNYGDATANGYVSPSKHQLKAVQHSLLNAAMPFYTRTLQSVTCAGADTGLSKDATFPMARRIPGANVEGQNDNLQLVNFNVASASGNVNAGGVFVDNGHFSQTEHFLQSSYDAGFRPQFITTDDMPNNRVQLLNIFDPNKRGKVVMMLDLKHDITRTTQTLNRMSTEFGDLTRTLTRCIQYV
jgi:hypothetical protein